MPKKNKMEKEYKKGLVLILVIIFLLIGYLALTNFIETKKLYPQTDEWFTFKMYDYTNNVSCIKFDTTSLSYYSDVSQFKYYKFNNGKHNSLMYAYIPIEKTCNYSEFWITFTATNTSLAPVIIDDEKLNLTTVEYIGNDSYKVHIKNESWDFYQLQILIPIKARFFNYYSIMNEDKLSSKVFTFYYQNSIFKGYLADESSFYVLAGNVIKDSPVFSNVYKGFELTGDNVVIRFNPKSKFWFLFQKILDAIILGLIAVMLYELLRDKFFNLENKIYKSGNQLLPMKKSINVSGDIPFLTIKDFLKEHSLNIVALSVFLLVTITLSSHSGALSHPLGVLSAGISYFLLLDLVKKDAGRDNISLGGMKAFILFFAILFCVWVILNLIIPFSSKYDVVMLIMWLIFILGVPVKLFL